MSEQEIILAMRSSIAPMLLVAVAPVLVGAASVHAPVPPEIDPKPAPTIDPKVPPTPSLPPFIATARRSLTRGSPAPAKYSGGPLSYDVEVVNPQSTELTTHLVVERLGGSPSQVARVPVSVPPNARAFVTFSDEEGLTDGCNSTYDRLTLETGTSTRTLKTTPECTFEMTSNDPTASLPPDRRLEQRRGRVSYHSVKLATLPDSPSLARPICGLPIAAQATARNDGSATAVGVRLRFAGPNGLGPLVPQPGFDLAPGKERVVEIPSARFAGHAGSYVLRIEASGVPVHQPGWSANVTRACSLDVTLEG